jgi:hypothetical protein
MKNIILCLCLTFIAIPATAFSQKTKIQSEITSSEDWDLLKKGDLVVKQKEIAHSAWPEITIYILVEATPLEAMGIFSALDYQQEYVPNVIKSKPIKHLSATEVLTEYEMHVPFPLPNAIYIHGSVVNQYEEDFELTWYMFKSSSTDEVKGSAYFTPYQGKTLFRYRSFIKPKSIFGALVKEIMLKDVKKTILAIRDHVLKLKNERSPLLLKYSEYISRALNGEFVYKFSN